MKLITDKDLDRGYSVCHCGAYNLHQAGFDADVFFCERCQEWAAAPFEIFECNKPLPNIDKAS